MTDWTRVPVVIGAAQHTNREEDPQRAPDPLELMALVSRAAAADAVGAASSDMVLASLTHVYAVHSLSLRHGTPAVALAEALRASGAEPRTSGMGGNIPQWLIDRAAEQVVSGNRPVVLVAGAEALATRRRAKKAGVRLDWPGDGAWPEMWPPLEPDMGVHPVERAAGLEQATAMYAFIETALAHASGRDHHANAKAMGKLMARFNAVAADNPYSWFPARRSADELTTVTADNRVIFHPYPKYLNAVMDVDMASALVVTDAERAREWGMAADEVAYLRGWADAKDIWHLSARPALSRSDALAACAAAVTAMADISMDEVSAFDIYSCFPSSVESALDALGISSDDPRPLTLTGGLPYHGGPGSNYVTHCVANALAFLREGGGDHALVHGNGYYLTKHALGLYSKVPPTSVPTPDDSLQSRIDAAAAPVAVHASLPGTAAVMAYTVPFDRHGTPETGVVLAEGVGGRTVARADAGLTQALVTYDAVSTAVTLQASGEGPDLAQLAG